MTLQPSISTKELKLLLVTTAFSFLMIFSSVSLLIIEAYNQRINEIQVEKMYAANGEVYPDFGMLCNFGATYPDIWSRFYSLVCLPLVFFISRKNRPTAFLASFLLLMLPLINFYFWFTKTQRWAGYGELYVDNFSDNFLLASNSFDLLLLCLIPFLVIWQATILCRSTFRHLQNKIALS